MRIAHVTWSMNTGGSETMLVDIVNEQVKSCEVWVFVINNYYDNDLLGRIDKKVKVTLLNRKPGSKSLWPMLKLNVLLLWFHPDVIHCHVTNLAPIIKVPFKKVLTIHNTHIKPDYFGGYDRLFCISNAVKEYITYQGFSNGIVVYNGIHMESIAEKSLVDLSSSNTKRMVCVGRLHPDKGQRLIIEAFNELINVRGLSGFSIDFIGDGNERQSLEELSRHYGLKEYIHFLGRKPRHWFYPRLKDYDLYVLPSISEGFGLTLAEACAAKLPVIACDLAGPMEIIGDGRFGMTFRTGDALDLADGIEKFLRCGIDYNQIIDAYQYVKNNFDVKVTAKRYLQEYKELTNL